MFKHYSLVACALALAVSAAAQKSIPANGDGPAFRAFITAPASIAMEVEFAPPSDWGPTIRSTISDTLVWASSDTDSLGCTPVTNDLTGKIGLVRRGACNFTAKAENVQAAGGVAYIICNVDGRPQLESLGGTSDLVNIPGAKLTEATCEMIYAAIEAGEDVVVEFRLSPVLSEQIGRGVFVDYPVFPRHQLEAAPFLAQSLAYYSNYEMDSSTDDSTFVAVLSVESPGGTVTRLDATVDTIQPLFRELILFETDSINERFDFSEGAGTYDFTITSDLSPDNPYTQAVTVTEDYFQTVPYGTGETLLGATITERYQMAGNRTAIAMGLAPQYRGNVTSVSFDVCNVETLVANGEPLPFIEVDIVDVDADNDFVLDVQGGVLQSLYDFDDANSLALGEYQLTGDERCNGLDSLITVTLEPEGADSTIVEPGKVYLVRIFAIGENGTPDLTQPGFASFNDIRYDNDFFNIQRISPDLQDTLNLGSNYLEWPDNGFFNGFFDNTFAIGVTVEPTEVSSANTPQLEGEFALAPNPAGDVTTFLFDRNVTEDATLELLSVSGQVLGTFAVRPANAGRIEISTGQLANGSYLVRYQTASGVRVLPLQVSH